MGTSHTLTIESWTVSYYLHQGKLQSEDLRFYTSETVSKTTSRQVRKLQKYNDRNCLTRVRT